MTGKIDPKSWEGHTPGPWRDAGGFYGAEIVGPDGRMIQVQGFALSGAAVSRPNAALCAAAPDLAARVAELEAERDELREALREIVETRPGKGDGAGQDYIDDIRAIARAALFKWEGAA